MSSEVALALVDTPAINLDDRRIEDYVPGLASEAAAQVNEQVAYIRQHMVLTIVAAREIGERLSLVKKTVGKGHWLKTLECIGIKERAAQYYLSLYRRFPILPPEVAARISLSAAYILSSTQVDDGTRVTAATIAGDGIEVDEATARFLRDAPAPLVERFKAQAVTKAQALGLQKALRKPLKPAVRKLAETTLTDADVVPLLDRMPDEDVEVIAATGYLQGMNVIPADKLTARDILRHEEDERKAKRQADLLEKRQQRLVCELQSATVAGLVVNGILILKIGEVADSLLMGDKVYVTIERMQS